MQDTAGQRLKVVMQARRMTNLALAQKLGISRNRLSGMLADRQEFDYFDMKAILDAFQYALPDELRHRDAAHLRIVLHQSSFFIAESQRNGHFFHLRNTLYYARANLSRGPLTIFSKSTRRDSSIPRYRKYPLNAKKSTGLYVVHCVLLFRMVGCSNHPVQYNTPYQRRDRSA